MNPKNFPTHLWYSETADQIKKDFGSMGTDIAFPENPSGSPDEALFQYLFPVIYHLLSKEKHRMLPIIYRIGLPENQLGQVIADLPLNEAAKKITQLIINSERQKVELRRIFR